MRYGKGGEVDADWLRKAKAEEGVAAPSAIPERPFLHEHLAPVWLAFQRLNAQRRSGFSGPERIGISEIIAYHEAFTPFFDIDDFTDFLIALDSVFLTYAANKIERDRKQQEEASKNKNITRRG